MASTGLRGREQPSSLYHTPFKPCPQPAVWFLSWVCVVLPPYTMRALHWAGGEHPSLQEGVSVHMLTSRFAAKSCLGALLPSPNPCLRKGLAACSWGQPGLQLEPGGFRASERELQASLAAVYVVLCTLGRAAAYTLILFPTWNSCGAGCHPLVGRWDSVFHCSVSLCRQAGAESGSLL